MTDLQSLLSEARIRWMIGGAARAVTGHPLVDSIDPKEVELRLLAVAGQDILMNSEIVPPKLEGFPDLAVPAFPFITGEARVYAHRVAEHLAKQHTSIMPEFLSFLEGRGVMIHPLDWTPKPDVTRIPPGHQTFQPGSLKGEYPTVETWSKHPLAIRVRHLCDFLDEDPEGGRNLIAELFKTGRANDREQALDALATQLTPQDIPFLESCKTDPSKKVRGAASQMLTSMGAGPRVSKNAEEASQIFERVRSRLLRRGRAIRQIAHLNRTQIHNRGLAFKRVNIDSVARAMRLDTSHFIEELDVKSLNDYVQELIVDGAKGLAPDLVQPLYNQMRKVRDPKNLRRFFTEYFDDDTAEKMLIKEVNELGSDAPIVAILRFGHRVPTPIVEAILKSKYCCKEIFRDMKELESTTHNPDRYLLERRIDQVLHTLPILLSTSQSEKYYDQLVKARFHQGDPQLYLLKINLHLKDITS